MPDALWWLPSVVVFALAGLLLAGAVVGFRRLGVRREQQALTGARELEVRAKGLIVQADNATREAEREVAFAEAQFGEAAAREVRTAVTRARGWLREAFLLQQRLDDAEPDSAAERRTWSARIEGLCRSVLRAIDEADAALAARRRAERGASDDAPALREDAEQLGRRREEARAALDRLATRFAPSALAGAHASSVRIDAALADAEAALAEAQRGIAASQPAAERLAFASDRIERAARDLGAIERIELELSSAQVEAAEAAALLDEELVEGRRERDRQEDADAAAALGAAVGDASAVMAGRADLSGDPFADRDRLRAARDRLEVARASARNAQGRLDGARGALGGAVAIAESQLRVAREAIDRGRGVVGADARTRLAEAERQLIIARQEPDPVAALDAARRASARASDAEALAMWDSGHGAR